MNPSRSCLFYFDLWIQSFEPWPGAPCVNTIPLRVVRDCDRPKLTRAESLGFCREAIALCGSLRFCEPDR